MISVFIFTSNDFRPWKIEERERERERERARRSPCRSKNTTRSHRSKTIAPLRSFKPTLVKPSHRSSRSSRHFWTTRKERDRESREIIAPPARSSRHRSQTHSHQIADEPTRIVLIAPDCTALTNPPLRRMGFLSLRSRHWWIFFGWVLFGS